MKILLLIIMLLLPGCATQPTQTNVKVVANDLVYDNLSITFGLGHYNDFWLTSHHYGYWQWPQHYYNHRYIPRHHIPKHRHRR